MAGFNVDTIRSTLQTSGGFATTEKYSVVFTGLSSQLNQGVNASFQYLCENVAIPTKSISGSDKFLSLIHILRCRRIERCRSRWSPYH